MVIILSVTSNWTALTSMEIHSTLAPVDANLDAKVTSKSIKDGVYDSRDTTTVLGRSPPKDVAEVDADLRGAVFLEAKAGGESRGEVVKAGKLLRVKAREPPKVAKASETKRSTAAAGVDNKD